MSSGVPNEESEEGEIEVPFLAENRFVVCLRILGSLCSHAQAD